MYYHYVVVGEGTKGVRKSGRERANNIAIAANIAITPNNLLGIRRAALTGTTLIRTI
jgi:hypothetical protein